MEYSPRMQELLQQARERHQKKLTKTIGQKLTVGYRFYVLIHGGPHKVYFRKRESAEHWLKSKYGYTDRDEIHVLSLIPECSI